MTAILRAEGAAHTDKGCVRAINEDNYSSRPELALWAVADGMGGHKYGDRASSDIVAELNSVVADADLEKLMEQTARAIFSANAKIFEFGATEGTQSGSTVVALLISDRRFGLLWAGDSRAYVLRKGELIQLSVDHTQVQEMIDAGDLTPADAVDHPMGHILVRAVGAEKTIALDAIIDDIAAGDVFLLCSDGLTEVISDSEITGFLSHGTAASIADALIAESIDRGAPDNVTVCVVNISDQTRLNLGETESARA